MSNSEQKEPNNTNTITDYSVRNRLIIKTSIIGIITNIFLVLFKLTIGFLSSSISIILDGINNLTDVVSSIVTIVGTKLASRKPDKKHPLGHGRIEYIATMVVSAIIIYAGITAAIEAGKKIFNPDEPDYSILALIIMAVAVIAKIILGLYVIKQGKKTNSGTLTASGKDALYDSVLSGSVLICVIITYFTGIKLEAFAGIVIAVFIVRAGIEMMVETIDHILGKRADSELAKKIKQTICETNRVMGAYDLMVNNYGPDRNYASVHIEVPDTMTVEELDCISREIEKNVYAKTGVILTGIGVYSYNTGNSDASVIQDRILKIVMSYDWALQMHGFHVNMEAKTMRFDVVMSFDIQPQKGIEILSEAVSKEFPDYEIVIIPDVDITD